MKKIILLPLLLTISQQIHAFGQIDHERILVPINHMFDAMREHNGEKLLKQFTESAKLERATKDDTVKQSDLAKFADFIGKTEKHLDEKLFNISLHQSGNLASAWTPFAFYLDGELSHCGINSFQLIKQKGEWKITYLIDNAYQGDCEKFIAQHKEQEKITN